jgi:general L-amino acid transport system permease protein
MTDTTATERKHPVGQHPDLPPPAGTIGVVGWIRHNLFPSVMSGALTIAALVGLYFILPPILNWAILDADFVGTSKADCTSGGACWVFIYVRFNQLVFGFYPSHLYWRPILAFVLLFVALYPLLFDKVPYRKLWVCFTIAYPVIGYFLLMGGLGLEEVVSDNLGGFMLTVVIGVTGIVASLPIGIVLAL